MTLIHAEAKCVVAVEDICHDACVEQMHDSSGLERIPISASAHSHVRKLSLFVYEAGAAGAAPLFGCVRVHFSGGPTSGSLN
jgi:hypothetical protein